jgi:hypothetical protein
MMSDQLSFLAPADMPEGLSCAPDFLSQAEEAALAAHLDALPFKPFEFHGFLGKRQTISFGWSYRFDGSGLGAAAPINSSTVSPRTFSATRMAAIAGSSSSPRTSAPNRSSAWSWPSDLAA